MRDQAAFDSYRLLRDQIVLSQLESIALRSLTAWDYDGHQQHTPGHGVAFRHHWCRKSSKVKVPCSFASVRRFHIEWVEWWREGHALVPYHVF